jgi:large subunit ribosomal protein L10
VRSETAGVGEEEVHCSCRLNSGNGACRDPDEGKSRFLSRFPGTSSGILERKEDCVNKQEKKEAIEELHEKFARAKAAVITGYRGINVEQITELRARLRKSQVEYRVVKNTLARRAAEGTGLELLKNDFVGPVGIALGYDDVIAPARELFEFSKTEAKLELKVGVLDGKLLKEADIKAVASLPSLKVLRGKIVGLLQAPASRMVGILAAPGGQVARVLKAKADRG